MFPKNGNTPANTEVFMAGIGIEPNDEFAREPFYCMFKAKNFDFYLMTIHTDPDDVGVEIPALKTAYLNLQENTTNENDIIMLGDFNAKAPGTDAESYITMTSIAEIDSIFFAINDETNTSGGRAYDNIIFQSNSTSEYINSGVFEFKEAYNINLEDAKDISDHLPVWASFATNGEDDD